MGTPGALVRKGAANESGVLPPLPAPVVDAAAVPAPKGNDVLLPKAGMKALRAALAASVKEEDCDRLVHPEGEPDDIDLDRLSPTKLLASTVCWRGAYNEGIGYWVIDAAPPFAPQLVTAGASSYADGVISAAQKGRGIGDCWASGEWTWNGSRFVQTDDGTTGMCKSIAAGGAWSLPTLVTEVRRASGAVSKR